LTVLSVYATAQIWQTALSAAQAEASAAVSSPNTVASQYANQYGKRQSREDAVAAAQLSAATAASSAQALASQYEQQYGKRQD